MDIKKIGILVLTLLICGGSIFLIRLNRDTDKPEIKVKENPINVSCKTEFSELMNYVEVYDEDLDEVFIEEKDLSEIVTNKKVTYVAIDKSFNVSKETVYISADSDVSNYYIEAVRELTAELKQDFVISDYFRVVNGCGMTFEANLKIDGLDLSKTGTYEITVSSINNSSVTPLVTTMTVADSKSPVIKLKYDEVILDYNETFDFKRVIDVIEDDKDTHEDLMNTLKIDNPVNITSPGKYEVKFTVTDSDGRSSSVTLPVTVKEEVIHEEYYEPQYEEPVYNEPVYEEPKYEEPSYEEPEMPAEDNPPVEENTETPSEPNSEENTIE